jgi:hypothetical protein
MTSGRGCFRFSLLTLVLFFAACSGGMLLRQIKWEPWIIESEWVGQGHNARSAASASTDGRIAYLNTKGKRRIVDLVTRREYSPFVPPKDVNPQFSDPSVRVLPRGDRVLCSWSLRRGPERLTRVDLRTLQGEILYALTGRLVTGNYSRPSGRYLTVKIRSGTGAGANPVREQILVDTRDGKPILKVPSGIMVAESVVAQRDGDFLQLYDLETRTNTLRFPHGGVNWYVGNSSLLLRPQTSADGSPKQRHYELFEPRSGDVRHRIDASTLTTPNFYQARQLSDRYLMLQSSTRREPGDRSVPDHVLSFFDLRSGAQAGEYRGPRYLIAHRARDGRTLTLEAAPDQLWDRDSLFISVPEGREIGSLKGNGLGFSAQGDGYLRIANRQLAFHDVRTLKVSFVFDLPYRCDTGRLHDEGRRIIVQGRSQDHGRRTLLLRRIHAHDMRGLTHFREFWILLGLLGLLLGSCLRDWRRAGKANTHAV